MYMKIFNILMISMVLLTWDVSAIQISECKSSKCIDYFKSFKKASHRGHRNAMYNLAKFYQYGFGTDVDKAKALNFYKKAGRLGLKESAYKAGELLLTDDVLYDFNSGVNWLQRAARQGQPNAAFLLGQSYFSKKKFLESDEWLTLVYKSHPQKIITWIEKNKHINTFNQKNLPTLHLALKTNPIDTLKNIDDDNIEVITITGISRDSILDSMLAGFRKRIKSTGTRLPNITCDQNVACIKKSLNEMKDSIWVSQK